MANIALRFREIDRDKFEAVRNGLKTIETRAATEKYRNIRDGDVMLATCGSDKTEKIIKEVRHFNSIKEMFEIYGIERILPGVNTLTEAEIVYDSFPGYKQKIKEYGIIALVLI